MRAGGHAGYEIAPFIPSLEAAAVLLHACALRCLAQPSTGTRSRTSSPSCRASGRSGADNEESMPSADRLTVGGGFPVRRDAEPLQRGSGAAGGARGGPAGEAAGGRGGAAAGLPCAALNTVQHHDMHHRFPTRHFSLYFTHWDRWCGTEHPGYRAQARGPFLCTIRH